MRFELPKEYYSFVQQNGVVECVTSQEPGYIQFWPTEDLEKINIETETELYAPGYFGFASDGGGEMIAFDVTGAIFKLPFIGMEPEEAILVARSFEELTRRFNRAD